MNTQHEFLLIQEQEDLNSKLNLDTISELPNVDIIQFCTLGLLEKGELGIREIHWKFSKLIAGSNSLNSLFQLFSKLGTAPILKISRRIKLMRLRSAALRILLKDFSHLGIIIPHYIEPRRSTLMLSRAFVQSLLEINLQGRLSLYRACFALARSSNFMSFRISGFKK